jgi:hypothetical protein
LRVVAVEEFPGFAPPPVATPGVAGLAPLAAVWGWAAFPRIMREYCEVDSIDAASDNRLVVVSFMTITDSCTSFAARETDALRGRCRAAKRGPSRVDL